MVDLETRLRELGSTIAYPRTPNLTVRVRDRLTAPPARLRPPRWRFALAAAAALLLVLAGGLLVSPQFRDAVAGWFGLKGVVIQRVPTVPSPTPIRSGTSLAERLQLGQQVSLTQARAQLSYPLLVPEALGLPDAVFILTDRQAVALLYRPRADLPPTTDPEVGLLLIEFPGQVQPDFFGKMLGPDATLENVTVNGNPGYWIGGKPHAFFYLDRNGQIRDETFRLAGNTLLWDQGILTLRIESGLDRDHGLAVAKSLQ